MLFSSGRKAERGQLLLSVRKIGVKISLLLLILTASLQTGTTALRGSPEGSDPPLPSCSGWRCSGRSHESRLGCQEWFLLLVFKAAFSLCELKLLKRTWDKDHCSTVAQLCFSKLGEGLEIKPLLWVQPVVARLRGQAWSGMCLQLHWQYLLSCISACPEVPFVVMHTLGTILYDMHGLLILLLQQLLLLSWPQDSVGAGFGLCCWLLSNKMVQQDRSET